MPTMAAMLAEAAAVLPEPETSSGRELLAHELTHVVQQSTGAMDGDSRVSSGMRTTRELRRPRSVRAPMLR